MTLDPTIEARVKSKRAAPLDQDADALALLAEVERLRECVDAAVEGKAEVFFAVEDRERLEAELAALHATIDLLRQDNARLQDERDTAVWALKTMIDDTKERRR